MQEGKIKRIVIDCTEEEHKEVKSYCSNNCLVIRSFCLEAILEKIRGEKSD